MSNVDNDPFGFNDFEDDGFSFDSDSSNSSDNDIFGSFESDSFSSGYSFDDESFGGNQSQDIGNLDKSFEELDSGYPEQPKDNSDKKKIIKTSLIAIGAGLGIILIALAINRLSSKNTSAPVNATTDVTKQTGTANNTPVVNSSSTSSSSWVQFKLDSAIDTGTAIESSFTVTEIKHYALVVNGSNDKQLKSIVYGNISGLVGTYEMELPLDKAQYLSIGDVFKVTYKLAKSNGYSIVSDLKY